jgi:predicted methyltransferase
MPNIRKTASLTLTALLVAGTVSLPMASMAQQAPAAAPDAAAAQALREAVNSPNRTESNRARDRYRNPYETLSFFGLTPGQTVVELWPGGGWYSEILGSYVRNTTGGQLTVAAPWERGLNGVRRMQTAQPDLWGHILLAEFPAAAGTTNPTVAPGSADLVLTFRNIHNWRFGGNDVVAENFRQIFAMLKPGGRLGVVEHRLPENMDSAMEETSGYMKRSSVVAYAEAAGFQLVGESDINANPRDTHNWPRGVWTLPPVSRGAAEDPRRDEYLAVGESDRMTLLFVKPGQP